MGGSRGGSSGGSNGTVRYAEYIEDRHKVFLTDTYNHRVSIVGQNPYTNFADVPVDVAFFGAGYTIANFPSLYDMFGKFVAGLNIEALWSEMYASTVHAPEINNMVREYSREVTDELDTVSLPRFQAGMRDIGAVMTSSYVVGKALLEDGRNKAVAKFNAELKYKMIPIAQERWKTHLEWNRGVITSYADVIKHFFAIKESLTTLNYEIRMKRALWPLTVMDFERANLGALQGATKNSTGSESSKGGGGVLGGALSGAAAGGMMTGGNPIGMVVGGVLGGVASLF